MEPQKIEYPKNIAIKVNRKEAENFIEFLKTKEYYTAWYLGNIIEKEVTYNIEEKEIKFCNSSLNANVTYKEFKELIEAIDIINTGTFIFTTEISGKIETEFIRNFFDNLGFNRGIWETNSSGILYCFDDFIITHTEFPSFISNSPRITEKDIQLILKHCNLTKKEQNMIQEKKIIHYKPKNETFAKAIKNIVGLAFPPKVLDEKSITGNRLKELGVFELWCEPVYKETEKEVTVGGTISLKIKDKKVFHKNEDITNYVTEIAQIWKNLKDNSKIAGYDFIIDDVTLTKTGCERGMTKLSDWYSVYLQIK